MNKKFILTILFVFTTSFLFAQNTSSSVSRNVVYNGIGLGSAIAVTISWSRNQSIFWAIVHGILSWFYVIYFYFTRKNN